MRFTNERANRPRRRFGTSAALLAALAATEPAFTTPAFAQEGGRATASEAFANAVDQATFLRALGAHPVLDGAHPRMTREIAAASVAALGSRVDSDNGAALVETLSYIGAQERGSAFAQELAGARIDRATGDAEWLDITADVEGFTTGQQLERGARVEVRRVAVDSRRVIPGMTFRRGENVSFDTRDFRVGGSRSTGESTTAIEIRIVDADGSSQLIGYMDACGNITPWAEAAAAPVVENPCPPRTAIEIEGLPANETITVMYAVRSNGNLRTLDGTQCPGVSLPEVCADCTTEVSSALLVETATALNDRRIRMLHADSRDTQDGTVRIEVPAPIRVRMNDGRYVTIDVNAGLQDGSIVAVISCPRNERGRVRSDQHSGILEARDWSQSEDEANGDETLHMRWNGRYRVEN
jgi:hypothetical protein